MILLAVGAFFFLEFEESSKMMKLHWLRCKRGRSVCMGKSKAAEQAAASAGELTPAPAPVPAAQPQHPDGFGTPKPTSGSQIRITGLLQQ